MTTNNIPNAAGSIKKNGTIEHVLNMESTYRSVWTGLFGHFIFDLYLILFEPLMTKPTK